MRDITGQRFGRLKPLAIHHSYNHKRFWICECECGKRVVIRQDQITTGKTKSCGCLADETKVENLRKINERNRYREPTLIMKNPRIYRIWEGMKARCYNPNRTGYKNYGGRGIEICEEWRCSSEAFIQWALQNGYEDHLTIDRIDVNGHYCPQNCRWATYREQNMNKRKNPLPER